MYIIFSETYARNEMRYLKKRPIILTTTAIIFLLFISLLSCICSTTLYDLRRYDTLSLATNQGNIYIGLQHETNPLNLEDNASTLDGFKEIHLNLQGLPFAYYEIYQQPLDCSLSDGKFFDVATQSFSPNCGQVPCVQISMNTQPDFNLSIISGRSFSDDDFVYTHGGKMPVIMGSNYKSIYRLGDCFNASYLFSPFCFEIIGFLDNNCNISISNLYIPLDDCIVMPSFEFEELPQSSEEYVTQKIHYANKTSGKLKVPETQFDGANDYLKDVISVSTVGDYSLSYSSSAKAMQMKGINMTLMFAICCTICLLFAVVVFILSGIVMRKFTLAFSSKQKIAISSICICVSSSCAYVLSQFVLEPFGLYYRITVPFVIFVVFIWIALIIVLPSKCTSKH